MVAGHSSLVALHSGLEGGLSLLEGRLVRLRLSHNGLGGLLGLTLPEIEQAEILQLVSLSGESLSLSGLEFLLSLSEFIDLGLLLEPVEPSEVLEGNTVGGDGLDRNGSSSGSLGGLSVRRLSLSLLERSTRRVT